MTTIVTNDGDVDDNDVVKMTNKGTFEAHLTSKISIFIAIDIIDDSHHSFHVSGLGKDTHMFEKMIT